MPGSFDAGNIISDFNFYNGWAMTEEEIQKFLDSHISGPCTTTFCLNILKLDTPTRTWDYGTCDTYQGAAGESAARIIFKVQRACGLSAKAILVTLQKEQGLITSHSVRESTLLRAMGYACPDNAGCDTKFYGFFNQVFAAARQLTWYGNPDGSYKWLKVGQSNQIRWYPPPPLNSGKPDCGSGPVLLKNRATAALYYYTPYQPNAAALAAWPGASSDACSSYGNRNFYGYYRSWFGEPKDAPIPTVTRLAGDDRWATSVEISKWAYQSGPPPVAYVASGLSFADALAAGPAAALAHGPMLLTAPDALPQSVADELKRLQPAKIVVVGGEASVSANVSQSLAAIAPVQRIAGADRFETSRTLARTAFPSGAPTVYLASGMNFPDALSGSAAAGAMRSPVILIDGRQPQLDAATQQLLLDLGVKTVKILGGAAAISAGIEASLNSTPDLTVVRFAGSDRMETSLLVSKDAFPQPVQILVASATNFPDALSGAAAAGQVGVPLLVTVPTCVRADVRAYMTTQYTKAVRFLGGPTALPEALAFLPLC